MKKKQKGFTLVELILVLALFSILMYSVLQLLDPVSKFFVRSSNYESNTSCIDNMKRAIEGNLKYANRVQLYYGYRPYSDASMRDTPDVSAQLGMRVGNFYEKYFKDRVATDAAGYIYVLALDNTAVSDTKLEDYPDIKSFNDAQKNSGKIILYKFWYDNYNGFNDREKVVNTALTAEEVKEADEDEKPILKAVAPEFAVDAKIDTAIQDWYVNQKMYGNYEYRFDLGMVEQDVDDKGIPQTVTMDDGTEKPIMKATESESETFDPVDFALTISMKELRVSKDVDKKGLVREQTFKKTTSTFSMKNVLDAARGYHGFAMDYVLQCDDEHQADMQYTLKDNKAESRYTPMIRNTDEKEYDGMYFIYTLPETCYTNGKFWRNQEGIKAEGE